MLRWSRGGGMGRVCRRAVSDAVTDARGAPPGPGPAGLQRRGASPSHTGYHRVMEERRQGHCSWCLDRTTHRLEKRRRIARDEFRCERCGDRTVRCRVCDDMARGPRDTLPGGLLGRMRGLWSDELCAVHDGTIPSFETSRARVGDLAEFRTRVTIRRGSFENRDRPATAS